MFPYHFYVRHRNKLPNDARERCFFSARCCRYPKKDCKYGDFCLSICPCWISSFLANMQISCVCVCGFLLLRCERSISAVGRRCRSRCRCRCHRDNEQHTKRHCHRLNGEWQCRVATRACARSTTSPCPHTTMRFEIGHNNQIISVLFLEICCGFFFVVRLVGWRFLFLFLKF